MGRLLFRGLSILGSCRQGVGWGYTAARLTFKSIHTSCKESKIVRSRPYFTGDASHSHASFSNAREAGINLVSKCRRWPKHSLGDACQIFECFWNGWITPLCMTVLRPVPSPLSRALISTPQTRWQSASQHLAAQLCPARGRSIILLVPAWCCSQCLSHDCFSALDVFVQPTEPTSLSVSGAV